MVTYIEATSAPMKYTGQIRLYGPEAFEGMRTVCNLTARCLDALNDIVKPGVTTNAMRGFLFESGMAHGAFPSLLHYPGYTTSTCTSTTHLACHGIPNDKPRREGAIVSIDVT